MNRIPLGVAALVSGLWLSSGGLAAQGLKEGNNADAQPRTPREQLATFTVPDGFTVELVASEETGLPKPVSIAFDDSGRMWSVTATEYPRDQDPEVWKGRGRDRVVVFDSPERPGPHPARAFADGMVMPMSVLPFGRGAIVAQGPEIVHLEDTDGDGKADARRVLASGFGVQDTHTMPHQLEHYPGNWIVFSQGVLNTGTAVTASGKRVNFDRTVVALLRPDGSDLQVIGTGLNNIWCWAQGRTGRVYIHEANDFGYAVVPFERDTTYPSFIRRLVHPDSPYHPPTSPNLSLGGTGFSGLALCDDRKGSFPAPWHGLLFVANPITRRVNSVKIHVGADGQHRFEQMPDLLASRDEFFRPVAIRFGPDGCLYVVDWYNRIISHNEIDRNHPARDKTRGRVWRIRHKDAPRLRVPDVAAASDRGLIRHLQGASTWEMRAAWHQLVARKATRQIPALARLVRDGAKPTDVRVHALWALEGLGHFDRGLWTALLASPDADLRFEAVRALSTVQPDPEVVFGLLRSRPAEPAFRVRWEILRYFRDCPAPLTPEQLAWLGGFRTRPDTARKVKGWDREYLAPGGPYEDTFQNLLLQMIAEKGQGRPPMPSNERWAGTLRVQPPRPEPEREAIRARVEQLRKKVDGAATPDLARGRTLFEATCAGCHSTRNDGAGFGPSLGGSRNRSTEAILTAVLDPSQAIESVFRLYHVETKSGESHDGFFGGETAEAITVRFAGGSSQTIPVKDIRSAGYVGGVSVMPEGLFEALDEERIVDLVRYVQTIP